MNEHDRLLSQLFLWETITHKNKAVVLLRHPYATSHPALTIRDGLTLSVGASVFTHSTYTCATDLSRP